MLDSTLSFLRRGYRFAGERCDRAGMGRRTGPARASEVRTCPFFPGVAAMALADPEFQGHDLPLRRIPAPPVGGFRLAVRRGA